MDSVMVVVDCEQGTPEWLEWRKSGVTATCSPILMGSESALKTPYQLYLQYVGLLAPEDLSAIKQVRAGNLNEPLARAWAERKYGQISLPLCVSHRDYPYMIASLDGQFDDGYLLEIKNLSAQKHLDILKLKNNSPDFKYYYWQVQHQLFVTGAPGAYLLFWSAKDEPVVFKLLPNPKAHDELLRRGTDFWNGVQNKVAPPFDKTKDVLLISDAEIVKQTPGFTVPDDLAVRVANLSNHSKALEKAKAEVERLDKLTKALLSGLADALGFLPDDLIRLDGFGVRYVESISKGATNWKSLAYKLDPNLVPEQHPDCVNNEKRTSRLTNYEYVPTSSDTIPVIVPDSVQNASSAVIQQAQDASSDTDSLSVSGGVTLF
ncbi:lambda-exonuclease family protein [Providencia huaxiensis]|uniref:lambda-exonuclease family protein n=1 Tax=Providencia huaxiensis TaxID=2027290 RepID=UPI0039F49700